MAPPATGQGVTLIDSGSVREHWADGVVLVEDGDTVRAICFATRYAASGAAPAHVVVDRVVMPRAGFVWSLRGALLLPCAAELVDALGQPLQ